MDRPGDDRLDESLRILASSVQARGDTFLVVVGASLDERDEALRALLGLELLGPARRRPREPGRQRPAARGCAGRALRGRQGDVAWLRVRDHGAGFPPHVLAHPFERFTRPGQPCRGSGLGLAVVQALVDAHGGSAALDNQDGACVTLRLPLTARTAPAPA